MVSFGVISFAVIVTVLGILYLATIGRTTDAVPFIGFRDDVLVLGIIFIVWGLVLLPSFLQFIWNNYRIPLIISAFIALLALNVPPKR